MSLYLYTRSTGRPPTYGEVLALQEADLAGGGRYADDGVRFGGSIGGEVTLRRSPPDATITG